MNYKFYANGKCTYVGNVEASSKEEALRKIKNHDYDDVELVDDEMNKYQELLQVLEKEHQITCKAADIEETDRAKAYFQLLREFMDKETPKKPIDIEIGPCGDLMLCCPTCEHGVVPIPTYHGNKYYPRCPFCGQKLMEEDKDDC